MTAKAATALRLARRERAGIKTELTWMRREQANELHTRLLAANAAGSSLVQLPVDTQSPRGFQAAWAHAAWLNDAQRREAARAELRAGVERYWDRKSEGAFRDQGVRVDTYTHTATE